MTEIPNEYLISTKLQIPNNLPCWINNTSPNDKEQFNSTLKISKYLNIQVYIPRGGQIPINTKSQTNWL
jgi:hypothetical protein